jgi:hypothetical protein
MAANDFYSKLLRKQPFTDLLVLNDAISGSANKSGVSPDKMFGLIDRVVLTYGEIPRSG